MKRLYKINLFLLKFLPAIMAISYLLNTQVVLMNTIFQIIIHCVGLVIAPILFMYLSSIIFNFCNYHRMFLHYITLSEIIDVIDYYFYIPVPDVIINKIRLIIGIIFLTIAIIMYIKKRKEIRIFKKPGQ